jgi:ubiquinone/menaquinone biosynthesis C-methylase UbiE
MASVAVPIAKRLVGGQVVAIDIQPGMLIRPQEKSRREAGEGDSVGLSHRWLSRSTR